MKQIKAYLLKIFKNNKDFNTAHTFDFNKEGSLEESMKMTVLIKCDRCKNYCKNVTPLNHGDLRREAVCEFCFKEFEKYLKKE